MSKLTLQEAFGLVKPEFGNPEYNAAAGAHREDRAAAFQVRLDAKVEELYHCPGEIEEALRDVTWNEDLAREAAKVLKSKEKDRDYTELGRALIQFLDHELERRAEELLGDED